MNNKEKTKLKVKTGSMSKPYLLFDAGGTIVFPDFYYLSKTASRFGFRVSPRKLFQTHCQLIHELDTAALNNHVFHDPFPDCFSRALFQYFHPEDEVINLIIERVEKRDKQKSLWTVTHPFVINALISLKQMGVQMSVISNSDGRVASIFDELDLRGFFVEIFDSKILKISKPDPEIFELTMSQLSIDPNSVIYIGDIFFIDVWGANQAGLGAIHLDPLGLYKGWPGIHLPDIAKLPQWLNEYLKSPQKYDLFPAKNMNIRYQLQNPI